MREAHPLVSDLGVELLGETEPCREVAAWLPAPPGPAASRVRGAERRRPVILRRVVVHVSHGDPYVPSAGLTDPARGGDGPPDGGWREAMRHHQVVVWRRTDEDGSAPARFVATAPGASATLGDGAVDFRFRPDARPGAARAAFEIIWPLLLPRYGLVHLHAGAVRDAGGRGWLLTGDANSGKSTGTLALATAGWGFAADDAVYVERRHDQVAGNGHAFVAHGWAEPFRLSARSAAALSVMRATPHSPVKSAAALDDDRAARRLPGFPIDRVVFTELGPRTTLRAATPGESLTRLLRSSGWIVAQPLPAADYLEFLAGLARVPAARLIAGPELLDAPGRLAEVLDAFPG